MREMRSFEFTFRRESVVCCDSLWEENIGSLTALFLTRKVNEGYQRSVRTGSEQTRA